MTDLQLGLVMTGAAAVVGVLVFNRLQERKARREAERAFQSRHADVLLDEVTSGIPVRGDAHQRHDDVPASGLMPDERVDYIITLRAPVGLPGASVLEPWRAVEQRFGRRVLLTGSDGSGWRHLGPAQYGSFTALRAALQLVSRAGVVSDAELQVALHVIGVSAAAHDFSETPFAATPREDGVTFTLDVARTLEQGRSF